MSEPQRHALRLTAFDDGAGGLNFLLSDGRNLALHERQALAANGLARWQGEAWRRAATAPGGLPGFGSAMAQALLPASVAAVLARQPGGWLHLQLGERQVALPWELMALSATAPDQAAQHLDQRFTVVRQVMTQAAPAAPLRHREPGALLQVLHVIAADSSATAAHNSPQPGRFGPLVLRVLQHDPQAPEAWCQAAAAADIVHLHPAGQAAEVDNAALPAALLANIKLLATLSTAPRLLIVEGLPDNALPGLASAVGQAGLSALLLPAPAPVALALFYAALADGAAFGVAAQRARAAARPAANTGADTAADAGAGCNAWFYGDGQFAPLPLATNRPAAPSTSTGRPAATHSDELRQVTILSCDLVDSTGLMHRLGDEEYSERLTHYHRRVAETAQQHGGLADDPQGDDGFMCYFGYPVASEDAAAQALRAGLALSQRMDDLGLQVRIGIATGRVVIRQGQPVGTAVHHAARLQQRAGAGGVLVSESTRQIAGERFEFCLEAAAAQLRGFEDGTPIYRVQRERPVQGTERFDARAHLTPFIGREAELVQLQQRWLAAAGGSRQALLLRGEAGIGKSRLVREFLRGLAAAGHRTLECRCAPEHSGSAFQPMIDLLRRRLQIHEADPPALQLSRLRQLQVTAGPQAEAALALLGHLLAIPAELLPPLVDDNPDAHTSPAERQRQRTMDLLARISLGLDQQAPVCLIVEDVHWIDPSTRALVQRLIDGPPDQRVLLLTLRSAAADEANMASYGVPTLALGGLGADAARAVLQGAIGVAMLDSDLAGWLTQRADGVPLFIEESARMAAALTAQQPASDIAASLRDAVPATLQDLLMARLDQLPLAKRAAQLGSALGRSFTLAQIEAVNQHADSPIRLTLLAPALAALVQAGLLTLQAEGDGQQIYSFKHALVRDAAYQSLLERDRRLLHGAIATVLQAQFASLCSARPELLAGHQEQAGLVEAAVGGWEHAAHHAAQRSAQGEAAAHLRRALGLLVRLPVGAARDVIELRLLDLLGQQRCAQA